MALEIKSFISSDISDFNHFTPSDPESFYFLLELTIGVKEEEGGDIFGIEVCTPKWLLENHDKSEVLFGRGKLLVFRYDIDYIISTINRFLSSLKGDSWEKFTDQLSKNFYWEFESYIE